MGFDEGSKDGKVLTNQNTSHVCIDRSKASSFAETYIMSYERHLASLHWREKELRKKFVLRVMEKEVEWKEAAKDLHAKFDKMKATIADEKRVVEDQRQALDQEIADFQRQKKKAKYKSDKIREGSC